MGLVYPFTSCYHTSNDFMKKSVFQNQQDISLIKLNHVIIRTTKALCLSKNTVEHRVVFYHILAKNTPASSSGRDEFALNGCSHLSYISKEYPRFFKRSG